MEQRESSSTSENVEVIPYLDDSTSEDDNNDIGKPAGYINAEEIADRYKQSKKWVHYLTRQKKVPRVQKAGILFYDEKVIEELFGRYASTEGITEWYTTDDIEEKYNMTAVARRSFTHRHNIPTKKEYGITYYSKLHVDFARNPGMQYAEDYYMVEQIMAKYHVDRETVYGIVRYKKIPSVMDGQYSLYLKTAVDKFFGTKNEDNICTIYLIFRKDTNNNLILNTFAQIYTLFNRIVHECGHCITRKNSASNQGTGQNDGKKRIDSAVLEFPFSRFVMRFASKVSPSSPSTEWMEIF